MTNEFLDTWRQGTPPSARSAIALRAILRMGIAGMERLQRFEADKLALDALRGAANLGGGLEAIEGIRVVATWIESQGRSPFETPGDFWDPELVAAEHAERRQIAWSCMLLVIANDIEGGDEPWLAAMKQASFRITQALGRDRVLSRPRLGPDIVREAAEYAHSMGAALPQREGVEAHPGLALLAAYSDRGVGRTGMSARA